MKVPPPASPIRGFTRFEPGREALDPRDSIRMFMLLALSAAALLVLAGGKPW